MDQNNDIPFKNIDDPFYNPENMQILEQSIRDAEIGKVTIHELIEVQK